MSDTCMSAPSITKMRLTQVFVMPVVAASSLAVLRWSPVFKEGDVVYIASAGFLLVRAVPSGQSLLLYNPGYSGNATPGTIIPVDTLVQQASGTVTTSTGGGQGATGLGGGDPGATGASGVQGATGASGVRGLQGDSSFANVVAPYTQPSVNTNVTINVSGTDWLVPNLVVFVPGGGYYQVSSVGTGSVVVTNLGYPDNVQPGNVVNAVSVVVAGVRGADGAPGSQGATGVGATGASGGQGATGVSGAQGQSAFTATTSSFVQPGVSSTVTIPVGSASWLAPGALIYIPGGGYYQVSSVGASSVVAINLGYPANATPGTTVVSGANVVTAGVQGRDGEPGATGVGVQGATGVGTQGATGASGVGTPGATGVSGVGVTGATGVQGQPAFSAMTSSFSQPDVNSTVTVNVGSAAWMAPGMTVYIPGGGYYLVTSVGATSFSASNLGVPGNASPSTLVSAANVVSAGVQGNAGSQGGQGATGVGATGASGVSVVGATGATGVGATGVSGVSAFATMTSSFTQPAVSSSVTVNVGSAAWLAPGMTVYIPGGGYYQVSSVGPTSFQATNLGYPTNASPTTTVTVANVVAAGVQGASGAQGGQGATGASGASVQGATGASGVGVQGATGVSGVAGQAASTATTSSFTQPAANASVTVSVASGSWLAAGMIVFIAGGGYYSVVSASASSLVLTNLGLAGNASPSTIVGSSATVAAAGLQGATGVQGSQGNQGVSGVQGGQGSTGATGAAGMSAATSMTSTFVQPAVNSTVTINVASAGWMTPGMIVYVTGGGYYSVSLVTSTSFLATNLGYAGSATVGATVALANVVPAGVQGGQGSQGIQGNPGNDGGQGATGVGVSGATGVSGVQGVSGAQGQQGQGAYTTMTSTFVQPAVNSAVTVSVGAASWMTAGMTVFIAGGGYYTVASPAGTTFSATNLGYPGSASPGATIATAGVVAAGVQGATGATGVAGQSAFTTLTSTFVQPSVSANVTVNVTSATWLAAGVVVYIAGGGYYTVVSTTTTTMVLTNLGYAGSASVGATVAIAKVSAAGLIGSQGLVGATGVGVTGASGLQGATGLQGVGATVAAVVLSVWVAVAFLPLPSVATDSGSYVSITNLSGSTQAFPAPSSPTQGAFFRLYASILNTGNVTVSWCTPALTMTPGMSRIVMYNLLAWTVVG